MEPNFLFFANIPKEKLVLACNFEITKVILKSLPESIKELSYWDLLSLQKSEKIYLDNGFEEFVLEDRFNGIEKCKGKAFPDNSNKYRENMFKACNYTVFNDLTKLDHITSILGSANN